MTEKRNEWAGLAVSSVVCLGAGAIGGILTAESVGTWYPTLRRPPLTPPDRVFGPVWTALYAMMAVAAWLVWRRRRDVDVRRPLVIFGVQLALNVVWSGLFFWGRNPGLALFEIVLLLVAVLLTTRTFRRVSPIAGALLLPYVAWVGFATYLNAGFWLLNR